MDRMVLRAYGLACLAMLLFTIEAALARLIGPAINAPQVGLVRSLIQFVFLAVWLRGAFRLAFTSDRPLMHVARGMLSAIGIVAYYYVFANLPQATATVIFFGSIVFTTLAAGPVLGEVVGWRRWAASLVGFAGIIVVARPTTIGFDWPVIIALLLAVNGAGISLATKGLTRTEPTSTIMGFIALTTMTINLPWAAMTWSASPAWVWGVTLLIGIAGTFGQWCSISSFRGADASGIAPVQYLRIVLSTVIGVAVFGETPDGATVVGGLLVAGSALYITLHEAGRKRRDV
jgi:drug/metabolite transporter (DMT)-like permease